MNDSDDDIVEVLTSNSSTTTTNVSSNCNSNSTQLLPKQSVQGSSTNGTTPVPPIPLLPKPFSSIQPPSNRFVFSQVLNTPPLSALSSSIDKVIAAPTVTIGLFTKEVRSLMYGLGDSKTPYLESVQLVEELMLKFVCGLVTKAQNVRNRPGGKVTIEDVVFVLRKDRAKFARVRELLTVNDELKKAKKAISDLDSVPAT